MKFLDAILFLDAIGQMVYYCTQETKKGRRGPWSHKHLKWIEKFNQQAYKWLRMNIWVCLSSPPKHLLAPKFKWAPTCKWFSPTAFSTVQNFKMLRLKTVFLKIAAFNFHILDAASLWIAILQTANGMEALQLDRLILIAISIPTLPNWLRPMVTSEARPHIYNF